MIIVLEEHSSSQLFKDWSAWLIKGGAILLPAPPFLLPDFRIAFQRTSSIVTQPFIQVVRRCLRPAPL